MVPWNSLYHKKTERRRYKKRCWRQALSFLSDNPRHHHYKEKEDARDCSHKSRNIFVKNIFNNSALHIPYPYYTVIEYQICLIDVLCHHPSYCIYIGHGTQIVAPHFCSKFSKAKLFLISNFNWHCNHAFLVGMA